MFLKNIYQEFLRESLANRIAIVAAIIGILHIVAGIGWALSRHIMENPMYDPKQYNIMKANSCIAIEGAFEKVFNDHVVTVTEDSNDPKCKGSVNVWHLANCSKSTRLLVPSPTKKNIKKGEEITIMGKNKNFIDDVVALE